MSDSLLLLRFHGCKPCDRLCRGKRFSRRRKPGPTVDDQFFGSANGIRDNWHPAVESFEERYRHPFVAAGAENAVERAEQQLCIAAAEEGRAAAMIFCVLFGSRAQFAITNQCKSRRSRRRQGIDYSQCLNRILLLRKAPDKSDNEVTGIEAKRCSRLISRQRSVWRDPVWHDHYAVAANAKIERMAALKCRHCDDAIAQQAQAALDRSDVERRFASHRVKSMGRVDLDSAGDASENARQRAGFRTVAMDYVQFAEARQRAPQPHSVERVPRADRAAHRARYDSRAATCAQALNDFRIFAPRRVNDMHFVTAPNSVDCKAGHDRCASGLGGFDHMTNTQLPTPLPSEPVYAGPSEMREAQSVFAQSPLVRWLFAAGLVAVPFDAVRGINAFGELSNELSFPFFGAAIAVALVASLRGADAALTDGLAIRIAGAALAVIAISYLVNFATINSDVFRERSGLNKLATSLLVILYGFALAWLTEQLDSEGWLRWVARFIYWSAAISAAYLLFEFAGKHGLLGGLFQRVDSLVHTRQSDLMNAWNGQVNEKVLYGWDPRLRSVSFEPPAFGNYSGFAWPWVWYAAVRSPRARQLQSWGMLVIFTLVVLLSASRTGLLMMIGNVATMALVALLYAPPSRGSEAAAALRLITPVFLLLVLGSVAFWVAGNYQHVVAGLMQENSVSNISRFGFQVASFNMFLGHPLLGVGLGQFGFHVIEYLPPWIFRSPEVQPMITYPNAPWPNVYSLYGRLAAELGLVGLIGWIVLWVGLAVKLTGRARVTVSRTGKRVTGHYPVVLNCVGVLISGITTDTFRTPMIWIALGLGCGLLRASQHVTAVAAPAPGFASRRSM